MAAIFSINSCHPRHKQAQRDVKKNGGLLFQLVLGKLFHSTGNERERHSSEKALFEEDKGLLSRPWQLVHDGRCNRPLLRQLYHHALIRHLSKGDSWPYVTRLWGHIYAPLMHYMRQLVQIYAKR